MDKHQLLNEHSMFKEYPDLVNIKQLCCMFGNISLKTGYKLLKSNEIEHFKIGRSYLIPKCNIIDYLQKLQNTTL